MKWIAILSLLSFNIAWGQIIIPASPGGVIPAPDNTTIVSKNNVWSCVNNSSVSYNSTTGTLIVGGIPVDSLTMKSITLNGSPSPVPGIYLISIDSNGHWNPIPYAPSAIGTSLSVPFALPSQNPVRPGTDTISYQVSIPIGTIVPLGSKVVVTPLYDPTTPFVWEGFVSTASTSITPGVITVRIWNRTFSNANFIGGNWKVWVN